MSYQIDGKGNSIIHDEHVSYDAAVKEDEFMKTIIDLAHLKKYHVAHFRTVRVQRKNGEVFYATPVQADGAGWVDLVLAKKGRLIFAEIKSKKGVMSPAQTAWKVLLESTGQGEYYCWRPDDWDDIVLVLSR